MSVPNTKSKRRMLRFWGWGYEDETLSQAEIDFVDETVQALIPDTPVEITPPRFDEFDLASPRLNIPGHLQPFFSTSDYDRLVHCYGKSFPDLVRMFLRQAPNAPDAVAFPENEDDITATLAYASANNLAVIPFGGGTSVCGGVEADVGRGYDGVISLDMENFNRIVSIDETSRRARIQGGMFGPDIEAGLKSCGLTLRHYPQSFPFSTLGGWIATRAGGHFATLYTHIDDMVEAVRVLTPSGPIKTRALPGSGAGPSADRLFLGSEGTLGIITEATMRLQKRPEWRASASIRFNDMLQGAEAVRQISQAGLFPANCRLLDAAEVRINRVARDACAILVLGFESADHYVAPRLARAIDIAVAHGGEPVVGDADGTAARCEPDGTAAETWRNAFIRMPYWRNRLVGFGIIADAFETAITWDRFPAFYRAITTEMTAAIEEITDRRCSFSCRFTHVYPDGPAPYFTFHAVGDTSGNLEAVLDKWRQIKRLANRLVIENGGTITHHHAVGRDHRSGYEQQTAPLFRQTLAAAKAHLDPSAILNPGVLIDPVGRPVGVTGALKPEINGR